MAASLISGGLVTGHGEMVGKSGSTAITPREDIELRCYGRTMPHTWPRFARAMGTIHSSLTTSRNAPAYFAESNAVGIALAPATNCKNIAVFEPLARVAIWKL
jgi:hypothetical protein